MISLYSCIRTVAKMVKTPFGHEKLDQTYEIPYLAGYNKAGDTIYIDKRLEPVFTLKDGRKMNVIKYLEVHEAYEKHLEDVKGYKYPYAHEKATGKEREAVEADGYPWEEYQNYALSEVKRISKIDAKAPIPRDYDEKPEKDSRDYGLLKIVHEHELLDKKGFTMKKLAQELDSIATDIQEQMPVVALALDKVSDLLDKTAEVNLMLVEHYIMKIEAAVKNINGWLEDMKGTEADKIKSNLFTLEKNLGLIKDEIKKK